MTTSTQAPAAVGERRDVARWLHVAIAAVAAAGLVIQLALLFAGGEDVNSGSGAAAVPLGTRLLRFFSYFTIQSNILVLVVSILLALRPGRDGAFWRTVRLDALLGIVITGIVYATILAPLAHFEGTALLATVLLHYVSPWLFLACWLLVGPRPRIGWITVAAAFAWPAAWIAYTLIHGAISGWYPYPFLNVTQLGFPIALRNIVIILLAAAVIAVIFRLLDRLPSLDR
ncbi:Pr6Pr family membrane protein [Microlunatus speluncae]|uniref:Pr6Pr family membrane protein n=1 Tax=Microlunatus speluncae TaxID=2594267 RepID=UPI0014780F4B|nr:Pr6Pr family membrane protein [Microlunatus speluncae]